MQVSRTMDVETVSDGIDGSVSGRSEAVMTAGFVSMSNEMGDEIGCDVMIHSIEMHFEDPVPSSGDVRMVIDLLDVMVPNSGDSVQEVLVGKVLSENRTCVRGSIHATLDAT